MNHGNKNPRDISMYFFLDKPAQSTVKTTVNETSISQNAQFLGNVIAIFIFLFQHQYLGERRNDKNTPGQFLESIHINIFWTMSYCQTHSYFSPLPTSPFIQLFSDHQCFKKPKGPRFHQDHWIQLT